MSRLAIYALIIAGVFAAGFGAGWKTKNDAVLTATAKQVVKVAKIEAKQEIEVEKQDDSDKVKIHELENQLSVARRNASAGRVPIPPSANVCLPPTEGNSRGSRRGDTKGESASRYEEAYRALRDELLLAGATAEKLRIQAMSCKAQWPK